MLHWLACVIFSTESARATLLQRGDADDASAAPLCSKVALVDSVEDPLEASPLCSQTQSKILSKHHLSAAQTPVEFPEPPLPILPSGLRAKEEEAVIRGAPAPSRGLC